MTALACLLALSAAPATPVPVTYVNSRSFRVHADVVEAEAGRAAVSAWMSRGRGGWKRAAGVEKDSDPIDLLAPEDGHYGITLVARGPGGFGDPDPGVCDAPQQWVVVDTTPPTAEWLAPELKLGRLTLRWKVEDANLGDAPIALSWSEKVEGPWTPVGEAPLPNAGKFHLSLHGKMSPAVYFRLTAADRAGNVTQVVTPNPVVVDTSAPRATIRKIEAVPTPPEGTKSDAVPPPPVSPAAHVSRYSSLPALRVVAKPQVKVGFDVAKVGPSGVGTVDVYLTADEGQTWNPVKLEGEPRLPKSGDRKTEGSVTVTLPKEGVIYGVYVVAKSGAGIGPAPPMNGTTKPHLRLEYDATAPIADLHMPQPDAKAENVMLFTWRADDRNLTENPITLQWAASADGPWNYVGEPQMANTGKHSWQVAKDAPAKVFLRLTVRDKAGNLSVATTPQAIPLDVVKPELSGFRVVE